MMRGVVGRYQPYSREGSFASAGRRLKSAEAGLLLRAENRELADDRFRLSRVLRACVRLGDVRGSHSQVCGADPAPQPSRRGSVDQQH